MICKDCKEWILSRTLGSMDVPIWHCRHGFNPSGDCKDMAEYNNRITREYYRKHPEELQLSLKFS